MENLMKLEFKDIDGKRRSFEEFRGKYILIVNVASECGFTPQYEQLQELYDHYREVLEIIAFPCNDFGNQEPGTNEEIKAFCVNNYNVGFTIASKVNIKSSPIHPVYDWLIEESKNRQLNGDIKWNFHKFLLDKEGELIQSFPTSTSPLDEAILSAMKISI